MVYNIIRAYMGKQDTQGKETILGQLCVDYHELLANKAFLFL